MKIFKINLIALIIVLFVFTGCEKEQIINEEVNTETTFVKVENNTLVFADWKEYEEYSEKVLSMEEQERREFERSIGFKSLATEIEALYSALLELNESKIAKIVDENNDIVKRDDNSNDILPLIFSRTYQTVANKQGFFYVGEFKYIVTESSFSEYQDDVLVKSFDINNGMEGCAKVKSYGYWQSPYLAAGSAVKLVPDLGVCNLNLFVQTTYLPQAVGCCSFELCQYIEYGAYCIQNSSGIWLPLLHKVWGVNGTVERYLRDSNYNPYISTTTFSFNDQTLTTPSILIYGKKSVSIPEGFNYSPTYKPEFKSVKANAGVVGFVEVAKIDLVR